jgi:voltage-gated potassium channel
VITGIIGPLYLAVVMGVLIGRYTNQVEEEDIIEHDDRR